MVPDELGGVHAWGLAESMGSAKAEREWSHHDADFVSFDPGRNIRVRIYSHYLEFVRENDLFTY